MNGAILVVAINEILDDGIRFPEDEIVVIMINYCPFQASWRQPDHVSFFGARPVLSQLAQYSTH